MAEEILYTEEQLKNMKHVFILAHPRTGSTLLTTMFNSHPNIIGISEEPFAYSLFPKYNKIKKWTSKIIQEYCNDFYLFSEGKLEIQFGKKKILETILENHKNILTGEFAIKLTYLAFYPYTKDRSNIIAVVDKQLKTHHCLKKLASYYPQSNFIILERDPRDNALARHKQLARKNEPIKSYSHLAYAWKNVYSKLLKEKNEINNGRFLEVKYEDLIFAPEKMQKKMTEFIGVPYHEKMMQYDELTKKALEDRKEKMSEVSKKHIALFHTGLTIKPNTNKIDVYKKELKKEDIDTIWTICKDIAEKMDYKADEGYTPTHLFPKNFLITLIIIKNNMIAKVWHACPFFMKRAYKKIRYGGTYKSHFLTSEEYYETAFFSD